MHSAKLESHKVLLRSNQARGVKRPEGGRREEKDYILVGCGQMRSAILGARGSRQSVLEPGGD